MSDEPRPRDTTDTILMVVGLVIAVILLLAVWWMVDKSRRASSEDKAVAGNLRMLVQAAEMYYRDHSGISSVEFTAVVGTDTRYWQKRYFSTVAQETYSAVILQSTAVTASGIAGARTITYAP
jgi:type IV pilus assembly protein PilA